MAPTASAPLRGAIYVRLSLLSNDEAKLGDQESMCVRVASENSIPDPRVLYDDGVTGYRRAHRDDFEELMRLVEGNELDVVIAQNQERFFRNPTDYARFLVACEVHRVKWLTVSEGWTDLTTADGKMQATIRFAFAFGESARKSERQAQRNEERRLRGDPAGGGRRPFGYGVLLGTKSARRPVRGTSDATASVDIEPLGWPGCTSGGLLAHGPASRGHTLTEDTMRNDTDETIHLPSTVIKRRVDGTECGSDHLLPGEEVIPAFTTRAAQAPPT